MGYERFTDNGDGTVTDTHTRLIWLKDTNCIATQYPDFDQDGITGDGKVTWQHALDFEKGINNGTYPLCGAGHTDWRLPNVYEAQIASDVFSPVPLHPFILPQLPWVAWWTSTTHLTMFTYAYSSYGGVGGGYNLKTDTTLGVWPVRGGH
jgi:hypothetical protein